ncbi:hypothetical protein BGW80DRAFT_633057 [Lactifluus volemus]|nr:hypothetical protein BGW80DRAFT_633057 [Lactifluus volemus]
MRGGEMLCGWYGTVPNCHAHKRSSHFFTHYTEAQPSPDQSVTMLPPPPLLTDLEAGLLNMIVVLGFGLAKFILSLQGLSVAPAGLEWVAGSALAALLYWIGLYEAVEPPKWEWFLHIDWAPAIVFTSNCFLRGALQVLALLLQYLLLFSIPLYTTGVLALFYWTFFWLRQYSVSYIILIVYAFTEIPVFMVLHHFYSSQCGTKGGFCLLPECSFRCIVLTTLYIHDTGY